jgi:hypothetical protein
MKKRSAGFLAALCGLEMSNFTVLFPRDAEPEDKALLLAATIFLDYRYFEEKE